MEARSNRFLDPSAVPLRQRPNGNVWAQLVQWTKWAVVLAASALLLLCFLPVFQKAQGYKEDKEKVKQALAAEQDRYRQLAREFELMKTNKEYVERVARDKLNLGKTGEMIFRFDPYPPAAPAPANLAEKK
jgi:cell division protein DivIC